MFRFLWDEDEGEDSWEVQLARRYYDKLFKEYCIIDLSRLVCYPRIQSCGPGAGRIRIKFFLPLYPDA